MAQVQGVVISVSTETDVKKQGGGTYKGWELVYKTPDGEVRTIAKPVQGLRYNAALKKALEDLSPSDEFTLVQEKNAQGFNDVKSIVKGFSDVEQAPAQTKEVASKSASTNNNSYTQRDFETKEERALKQKLIVRQSSVAQAVQILSVGAKSPLKVDEVKEIADALTDYVYNGTDTRRAFNADEELGNDIPL